MKTTPVNYWQKFEEQIPYHIYNRSNNKELMFKTWENYYFFLRKWKELIVPFFETGAFCLLPTHFHFLAWVKPVSDEMLGEINNQNTIRGVKFLEGKIPYNDFLEDQFKRLFQSYALAINRQEKRSGSLFQKRFKRLALNNENKILDLLAYIHHNPIHHGLVLDYPNWKFSSYRKFLSDKPTAVARDKVFHFFDQDSSVARNLFLNFHKSFRRDGLPERLHRTLTYA